MDICVCGAQVPFMRGGAELHMENLVGALRDAGHRAELVRLPTAWDRDHLFESALAWRLVPIEADLVIATNFPSYYVRHPNKVVWLFHQHRPAYDLVDTDWSDFGLDDASLEAQRMLVEWDTRVLEEARLRFTTSGLVAARLARSNGLVAEPLYHPPPLFDRLHEGPFGDYVLCATRLEGNKRPRLLVDAMAQVRSGARLVLAGTGSLDAELREAADAQGSARRVEMPGFVPDDELVERFAGALAVVYAPVEEDYGYVTLQAFRAGKPVITAADAGGVLEWVEDGVTGIVTDGTPAGVAAAIDRLADAPTLAEKMGAAARERVAGLAWGPVVERLVGG
ncbi:MAG: glycosyltransferase family 4 protein [Actinobacteria bacterium]|nr:glycosyltransferase family 4 protein [Actinomycetota bacterium]